MVKVSTNANCWLGLVIQILLMMAISLASITIYDRLRYQRIITVDIEWVIQHKLDRLQKNSLDLDQNQMLTLSQTWASEFADQIKLLASEHNAVVFARPAVIEGSIDMTTEIINRLNQNYGGTKP